LSCAVCDLLDKVFECFSDVIEVDRVVFRRGLRVLPNSEGAGDDWCSALVLAI